MALDAVSERRSGQVQTRPIALANERTNRLDSHGQTDFATSAMASDRVLHAQRHNGQGTENHALVVAMRCGRSSRSVANRREWRHAVKIIIDDAAIQRALDKRGELPTEGNGFCPQWFPARSGSVAAFANVAIDLDVGRPNLPTSGAAIGLMADAVQEGKIPAPTFMAHSGRGAYAIWQLREAVQNTDSNRVRWRAILLRLVSLTDKLGLAPDANALKQAQWLKVPGTLDTKTQNRVLYLPFMLNGTAPTRYTLDELETALGLLPAPSVPAPTPSVPALESSQTVRRLKPRGDKRHGGYVHTARITEIVALSNSRGGMAEGVRHMTLFYYYASCRAEYACLHPGSGMAHAWAVARTVELNATFSPPLDAAEVMSAVKQSAAGQLRRWQADTIARALQVAPSEADALGLHAIAPASVRKRKKEHDQVMAKSRHEARLQRADAIRALIAKYPKWSDLDIARELGGVDRKTVANHRAQMERALPDGSDSQRELPGFAE